MSSDAFVRLKYNLSWFKISDVTLLVQCYYEGMTHWEIEILVVSGGYKYIRSIFFDSVIRNLKIWELKWAISRDLALIFLDSMTSVQDLWWKNMSVPCLSGQVEPKCFMPIDFSALSIMYMLMDIFNPIGNSMVVCEFDWSLLDLIAVNGISIQHGVPPLLLF